MASIMIQFVDPDGTYKLRGLRVRAGPGSEGPGTLYDEFKRGVRTPLDSEEARKVILGLVGDTEIRAFIRALPAVRMVPKQGAIAS